MGGTGAAGDEADAWSAGQLAVGIGHVRGGTLVAGDDGADAVGVVQRVEHRQVAFPGDAVDGIDGIAPQCLYQDLPAVALGKGVGHEGLAAHVVVAPIFGPKRASAKRPFFASSFPWRMNPRSSFRGGPFQHFIWKGWAWSVIATDLP